jgi:hypothetical protein
VAAPRRDRDTHPRADPRLDAEDIQSIGGQAAGIIPGARLRFLDGVAHLPHLEGDPAALDEIAEFVDALG